MANYKRKQDPFNLELIEKIKENECLWNCQLKEFYNRAMVARAWLDVADKMKKEVSCLRAKWRNLKDTYRKEVKKTLTDEKFQSVWLYFEQMSFLRDTIDITERTDAEAIEEVNVDTYSQSEQDSSSFLYLNVEETPPEKRKKIARKTDCVEPLLNIHVESKTSREDYYDEIFLESLVPFFKRLEPMRKLTIRSKIQEAVVKELTRSRFDE